MGIFTEIYSFKLNVVRYTNVVRDNLSSSFCWEHIEFITKICLYNWMCRLLRKCKLPFSFKAATPCSINKCLSKCCTRHKPGFNLSFGSVAVKIHPFTNSSWVNKDENIKPNKLSQPIGHSRSHSY